MQQEREREREREGRGGRRWPLLSLTPVRFARMQVTFTLVGEAGKEWTPTLDQKRESFERATRTERRERKVSGG